MEVRHVIAFLGVFMTVWSSISYVWGVWRQHSKAHRFTRFALIFAFGQNLYAVYIGHGHLAPLILGGFLFLQGIVTFGLSMRKESDDKKPVTSSDKISLIVALVGSATLFFVHNPWLAAGCAVVADVAAYKPTFEETWQKPDSQKVGSYLLSALAALLTLCDSLSAAGVFLGYLVIMDGVMTYFICRKNPRKLYFWRTATTV
jgi:hypothetical protein